VVKDCVCQASLVMETAIMLPREVPIQKSLSVVASEFKTISANDSRCQLLWRAQYECAETVVPSS
jgi:hypothetical protein